MATQWHDVNAPGVFVAAKKDAADPNTKPSSTDESSGAQAGKPAGPVRFSGARFVAPARGFAFNEKCSAEVKLDAADDATSKAVTFKLFSRYNGAEQDMGHSVDATAENGLARADLTLFYNDQYYEESPTDPSATVQYHFTVEHKSSGTRVQSEPITLPGGAAEEVDISAAFYSPVQRKFLVFDKQAESGISAVSAEVKAANDFAKKVMDAWQQTEPATLLDTAKQMAEEAKQFIADLQSNADKALDELLVIVKPKDWGDLGSRVIGRSAKLSGAAAKLLDAADAKLGQDLQMLAGRSGINNETLKDLSLTLDYARQWPWNWKYTSSALADAGSRAAGMFADNGRAVLARLLCGCGLSKTLTAKTQSIAFKPAGKIEFSLLDGSFSGSWYLPDQHGANLFEILGAKAMPDGSRLQCLIRFQAQADAHAVASASLASMVALPNINVDPGLQMGGSGSLKAAVDWAPAKGATYRALATIALQASVSGAALGAAVVDYKSGSLTVSLKADTVPGFEGSGWISCEVKNDEAVTLAHHLVGAVLHHFFSCGTRASQGFRDLVTSRFTDAMRAVEQKTSAVSKRYGEVSKWFSEAKIADSGVNATWYLPEEHGFDLYSILRRVPLLTPLLRPGVECWLRFKVAMNGYLLHSGSGGASGAALAAAGGGVLSACAQWRPGASEAWRTLGYVQGSAGLDFASQLSLAAAAAMSIVKGRLICAIPLASISALRCSSPCAILFDASKAEGEELLKHLYGSTSIDLGEIPGLDKLPI